MDQRPTADEVIECLQLESHPEQISFREIYRSARTLASNDFPNEVRNRRSLGTSIVFLVRAGAASLLHRVRSDEVWHFHAGDPLKLYVEEQGKLKAVTLGTDFASGHRVQAVVPGGAVQGAEVCQGGEWTLLGATVVPGFDFDDFELVSREEAKNRFPQQKDVVERLTKV